MPARRRWGRGPVPGARSWRRALVLLAVAGVVVAGGPAATAADPSVAEADGPGDSGEALVQLREDAAGPLEVSRDDAGAVTAVSSVDGGALLETRGSTPAAAAREVIAEHGEVFGIDGDDSRAQVTQTLPSVSGGTVVRAQQVLDGLPVFGGQVVTVLDAARDVVAVSADTTLVEPEVGAARVTARSAQRTAEAATARAQQSSTGTLTSTVRGRRVYDPRLVGAEDPRGSRVVWEVEVRDGAAVRETVLVGAARGEVALRFDDAPRATDRWVCDNAGSARQVDEAAVPVCSDPAMREGDLEPTPSPEPTPEPTPDPSPSPSPSPGPTTGPSPEPSEDPSEDPGESPSGDPSTGPVAGSGAADVVAAYRNLGHAADTIDELRSPRATSLTQLVGHEVEGRKRLVATVRWCVTDEPCPYENAFWDGTQMVFGEGYAAADDVVAHELTHGFVERTSRLFYFQQSGAINESLADTIGELADHSNGTDDDSAWTMGEDSPLAARSLRDPTLQGLPDRMTSPLWQAEDWDAGDRGAVHHNLGVGNRTAYLVSQGEGLGTGPDGQQLRGIDDGDPTLTKTGTLYLEVIPRLTSGAQYADLGRTLSQTCRELVASSTADFVAADCDTVDAAVDATELARPPAAADAALGEAPAACPVGSTSQVLARDTDARSDFRWETTFGMWDEAGGASGIPSYAREGTRSLFGYDPDPSGEYADAPVSTATSRVLGVPLTTDGSFFHFHHAFAFDRNRDVYFDGATVDVLVAEGGDWVPAAVPASAWTNGPDQDVVGQTRFTGFGGDSRGWGSSRLDLTPWSGQSIRLRLRIEADQRIAAFGWWLDDMSLVACDGTPASAPRGLTVAVSGPAATLRWQAPASGAAPQAYEVTRSDGPAQLVAGSAGSTVLRGLGAGADVAVGVRAVAAGGARGAAASARLEATTASLTASAGSVRRGQRFALTTKVVERGTTTAVRGVAVALQRLPSGSRTWTTVARGTTASTGAVRWTVSQRKATAYRVVVTGSGRFLGSTGATRTVRMR